MEQFAPWLSARAKNLFDEAERAQLHERALRVIGEHHRVAVAGLTLERLLEARAIPHLLQARNLYPGHYLRPMPEVAHFFDELPTQELKEGFQTVFEAYEQRVVTTGLFFREILRKELATLPPSEQPAALGRTLFQGALQRQPVGTVTAVMKQGCFELICESDEDYAALFRRHGTEELPGEKQSAACHISEVSLTIERPEGQRKCAVTMIVFHEKRSKTGRVQLRRHELQHFIQHTALKKFSLTEPNPVDQTHSGVFAWRSLKDEVLAFTREGRSAQNTKSALDGDSYKRLFTAFPEAQRTQVKTTTHEIIDAIATCVLLQAHVPSGRDLLVNLLYRIPFTRIPVWIQMINDYYTSLMAAQPDLWSLLRAHEEIKKEDPVALPYSPDLIRTFPADARARAQASLAAENRIRDLKAEIARSYNAVSQAFVWEDLLLKKDTPPPSLPAWTSGTEIERQLAELEQQRELQRMVALELVAIHQRRFFTFSQDIQSAITLLPSTDEKRLADSFIRKELRPALAQYTKLLDQSVRIEAALTELRHLLQSEPSIAYAIAKGDLWRGRSLQRELEVHTHELERLQIEREKVEKTLLHEGILPPSLHITTPPRIAVGKGPHPFEVAHESLLKLGNAYQRRSQRLLVTVGEETPRYPNGQLQTNKRMEAAQFREEVIAEITRTSLGRIHVNSCLLFVGNQEVSCRLTLLESKHGLTEQLEFSLPYKPRKKLP